MAMIRPDPPPSVNGVEWEAVTEREWKVLDPVGRRYQCRFLIGPSRRRCPEVGVAVLYRGTRSTPQPWAYCEGHMYGRWIEGGKVLGWRAVDRRRWRGA